MTTTTPNAQDELERLQSRAVPVVVHPAAKDASDLDLAVQAARERGARTLTLTAASTGRVDHTLAALGTLLAAADLEGSLAEPSLAAWALDARTRPSLHLTGPRGALLSVFAVGGTARGVAIGGVRFPLNDAVLEPLSSHGLSNELTGGAAAVLVGSGRLLVVTTGTPDERALCAPSHSDAR
jgi:thiamine pyrophosphokinase